MSKLQAVIAHHKITSSQYPEIAQIAEIPKESLPDLIKNGVYNPVQANRIVGALDLVADICIEVTEILEKK